MTYNQRIEIKDWGPAVTKLILSLDTEINAAPIDADSFTVQVKRFDQRVTKKTLIDEGEREVRTIYVSDPQGNKTDSGSFLCLDMAYHPEDPLSSPMNYYGDRNAWIDCQYTITQKKDIPPWSGLVFEDLDTTFAPQLEDFNCKGQFAFEDPEFGEIILTYANYKPYGSNLPLIIWLHGLGEGGTDPSIPVSAHKACNFASEEIQRIFGGAAFVLVPQCPTFWMDTGAEDQEEDTLLTSKYTRLLKAFFDFYLEKNPGIDPCRIYLGGCSNGGFMTQLLIMEYPDYFAGAFPVCSAALDSRIPDKQLKAIRHLPIWFVHAVSDSVVPATKHSLATFERLVNLKAPQVYYSYPRYIQDQTGLYRDKKGIPHTYHGHCSWIPLYNNQISQEINGKTLTILEWLSQQRRSTI